MDLSKPNTEILYIKKKIKLQIENLQIINNEKSNN